MKDGKGGAWKWGNIKQSKKKVEVLLDADVVELLYKMAGDRKQPTGEIIASGIRLLKAVGESGGESK